jgi:hypothetical protein
MTEDRLWNHAVVPQKSGRQVRCSINATGARSEVPARSPSATALIAKGSPAQPSRKHPPAPAAHFVLHTGTPKSYVKTTESGNSAFCGDCACAVDNPQSYSLRVGRSTQRAAFAPQRQVWWRCALDWVDALAAVPASEKG